MARWQSTQLRRHPRCLLLASGELNPPAGTYNVNNSLQTTIGFQRQLGTEMVVESDYVYTRGRNEKWVH